MTAPLTDESELNAFSATFARELFSLRPSWRQFALVDTSQNEEGNFLVVKLDPPVESRSSRPLAIYTNNDEVTVEFDVYHSHFYWPGDDEFFGNPIKFVDDIIDERLIVVSFWAGEKWAGSRTMVATQRLEDLDIPSTASVAKLRSWKGRYSTDHILADVRRTSTGNNN
jgi:hypothetical protein